MRVFRSLESARPEFGPCALTIGNFDGCHVGHQAIFEQVKATAAANGWKAAALTFDPHPACVVAPAHAPKLLSSVEQRIQWMADCGLDEALVLPFDAAIAALSPEEFVRDVLTGALGARSVMVGDNFRFGHAQAGNVDTLAELAERYGYQAEALAGIRRRGVIVSSSEIRRLIGEGAVARAARLLGRFYSVEGDVVKGHGIGSKQTVPTLNLDTTAEVVPATGVYVTHTRDLDSDRNWPSVTNIGYRPTFGGDRQTIETFLLAPLDETPRRLQLTFLHRIREERKFDTPEALKAQILRDVDRARTWRRRSAVIIRNCQPSYLVNPQEKQ